MTEFTLDTSGAVEILNAGGHVRRGWLWSDLSPIEQGYVGAMFASINGDAQSEGFSGYGFSDLAPETLAAIRKDCAAIAALIPGLDARDGRDIWTARQKGFPGTGTVTEYMRAHFPPLAATLGDDGRVYLREAGQ